jgi:hypothetical protein
MRSVRNGSRSRCAAVIVALVAGSLAAATAPAFADDFSPTVSSFVRSSGDVLGSDGAVSLSFEASDEGPAGLIWVMFTYRTPLGAELRVDSEYLQRAPGGTFIATRKIGQWAASGRYVLDNVEVLDLESNRTKYERETATQFGWAQADFTVDNPNQDTTVPTLAGARLFQESVAQGTPVVVLYEAQDDLSGVERVVFYGWNPGGHQYWVESLPQLGAVGPAAWVVPLEAASGRYESIGLQVHDRAGNFIEYSIYNGTLPYPPQATVPAHPDPDLASLSFDVFGTTGDRVSPRMSSLSALTEGPRRLGEIAGVRFDASDQGTGIEQIAGQWIDGKGHYMDFSKVCDDRTIGYASTTIEDYRTLGSDWQMVNITFGDYLGNQTTYNRNGSMYYDDGESDRIAGTHSFDLSVGDFHLEEGAARPSDLSDTTKRWCPKVANVTLELDDPTIALGDIVSAFGDVKLGGTPIPDPVLAIHEYVDGVPQLIDVVQGGDAGDYVDDFVAETKGQLQATFLGKDGLLGSQRSQSPLVDLIVGTSVAASLDPATIPLGAKASISGHVSPAGDGGRVWLQRRYPWGWKDVRSNSVGTDGSFTFSLQPSRARTYRYRILRPGSDTLVAAKSRVLSLKVEAR